MRILKRIFILFYFSSSLFAYEDTNKLLIEAKKNLDKNETKKAIGIYQKLYKKDVAEASYSLGMIYGYRINNIDKNNKLAIKYLEKATLKNHKKAPFYLALILSNSNDANQTKIENLVKKSAYSGFNKAQFQYGKLLLENNKTKEACFWIDKARKQDNMDAETLWKKIVR